MNKIAALTGFLWVIGIPAYAADASFNEAVNLYLKGYADCREANALRTDDIKSARQRFDNYLKILDQATAIDPTILKTTERDMDANITYCNRVNENLKMAEAAPILESGFEQCEQAKTALAANNLMAAQQALDTYAVQRDQALAITGNIMEVFSLASQVRACTRLEEKLAEARKANDAEAAAIADLQQQLNHYSQKCQIALGFTRQSSFSVDTIDQANRLLAEAQRFRKLAERNTLANQALQRDTIPAEATSLKQLEAAAGRCEAEVVSQIRSMGRQRSLSEQTLESAIASLQKADKDCKSGLQQLTQGNASTRQQLASLQQQVRKQVQQGTTSAIVAISKRHPDWSQSKRWQQASQQASQCQQALGTALAKAEAAKPVAAPAPVVTAPATRATPPSEPGPSETLSTPELADAPLSEASEPTAAGLRDARPGNNDWTELAEEPEEDADALPVEKKPIRKSWTDLVQ